MANPNLSQVQSVGDFSAVLNHPLVGGGASISLVGFKLDGTIIEGDQDIDNAKVIPLVGGIVQIITNAVRAGVLRWTAIHNSGDPLKGDIVAISQFLQGLGDNVGGTLRVSWGQNGVTIAKTFFPCVVKRCKPIAIAGNDLPDYAVEWAYGSFSTN